MKRYLCPYPGCGRPALRVKDGQLLTRKSEVLDPEVLTTGSDVWLLLRIGCSKGHFGYLPSPAQKRALFRSLQRSKATV